MFASFCNFCKTDDKYSMDIMGDDNTGNNQQWNLTGKLMFFNIAVRCGIELCGNCTSATFQKEIWFWSVNLLSVFNTDTDKTRHLKT